MTTNGYVIDALKSGGIIPLSSQNNTAIENLSSSVIPHNTDLFEFSYDECVGALVDVGFSKFTARLIYPKIHSRKDRPCLISSFYCVL